MIFVGLAAVVVSVAGLQALRGILGPAFLALVLVITVHPLQDRLRRWGTPAWLGVLVLLVVVYGIVLILVGAMALSVTRLIGLLPDYAAQFRNLLDQLTGWLADVGVGRDQVNAAVDQLDLSRLGGVLRSVLGGLSTTLSEVSFVIVLIFFLGTDAAQFPSRLDAAARSHPELVGSMRTFARGTRRYIAVSTLFGLVVATVDVGALYWLAIPLPLLWGLLAFITNYIPNVGFVLGLLPPALLALLEGGVAPLVEVVVAYSLINVVIQSFVQPRVVGSAVGLSATLTFLSLVFWSFVIGPLGALLAVPLSLLVKAVLVDADPANQWLRPLLGDRVAGGRPQAKDGPEAPEAERPQEENR